MRCRVLLAVVVVAGALAACGDDAVTTEATEPPAETTATTQTTTAPESTATTAAPTTSEAAGYRLDSDGKFAVAEFDALRAAMEDIRAFAELALTGDLTEDEFDFGVHALTKGEIGDAVAFAFYLGQLWLPDDTPALEAAAALGGPLASELDTALFYWDETWHKEYNEVGPAEVIALLDEMEPPFLDAVAAAEAELLDLGADPEYLDGIRADRVAVLQSFEGTMDDISEHIAFDGWAWQMSDIPFWGDEQMLKVTGWVTNTGTEPFDFVEFDVSVLNTDGEVMETAFGITDPIVLFPGERQLVRTLGWNDTWFERHIDEIGGVMASPPTGQVYSGYSGYRHDFEFTVEGTEEWGGNTIDHWGTVTNTGDLPQESVRIVAIGFDADGNVIGWGDGSLGTFNAQGEFEWASWDMVLEPGDSFGYKLSLDLWWPADLDRVEISAEGSDGSF